MATIVTRAGKGSALTHNEVDANFNNLNNDKIEAAQTVTLTNKTLSTGTAITAGTINGATIGATTPSSGAFTTLSATGVTTVQAGTVSAPAITTSGDTNTGIFFPAADTIAFTEGGVESMRIDSSGNLGLGVTPSAWGGGFKVFELVGGSLSSGASTNLVMMQNAYYDGTNYIYKTTSTASRYWQVGGAHVWFNAPSGTAGNTITFTQAMTLDASGNLGVGTSSPNIQTWRSGTYLTVANASTRGQIEIDGAVADSSSASLGALIFTYSTNTTNHKDVALIEAISSGATANQRGGVLNFYTKANGTAAPSLNMTLDASGNLGLGITSPVAIGANYTTIDIRGSSGGGLRMGTTSTSYGQLYGNSGGITYDAVGGHFFYTSSTERARITSGGDFLVGTTTAGAGASRVYINGDGTNPAFKSLANTSTTTVYAGIFRHESTTAGAYIQFVTDSNVETGRIYDSAGTMQYASSSDARLKTNVQPMQNSLQSVLALNPCTFDMRRGEDTFIPSAGLIAQEVHEVYPYVVGVGGDDENTNPWSVDYGKLTPLLVAAIKEQQAMIDELKAKVAALENA